MDKEALVKTLKEIQEFYKENKEIFGELSGAVTLLLGSLSGATPEQIVDGFEWKIDLIKAEKLLDADIAKRKQGAKLMQKLLDLLFVMLIKSL